MAAQRVLLLGAGDLTEETGEALAAAGADVTHLEDPSREALAEALEAGADAVAVVSRDDAWPLRVVLLVRHLDADVPIVATISDRAVGRRLEAELGGSTIVSIADIVAPSLAGPCLADELAAVFDGDPPQGLTCRDGDARPAPLPEVLDLAHGALDGRNQPLDRARELLDLVRDGLDLCERLAHRDERGREVFRGLLEAHHRPDGHERDRHQGDRHGNGADFQDHVALHVVHRVCDAG